jgi:hypothetical protein
MFEHNRQSERGGACCYHIRELDSQRQYICKQIITVSRSVTPNSDCLLHQTNRSRARISDFSFVRNLIKAESNSSADSRKLCPTLFQ